MWAWNLSTFEWSFREKQTYISRDTDHEYTFYRPTVPSGKLKYCCLGKVQWQHGTWHQMIWLKTQQKWLAVLSDAQSFVEKMHRKWPVVKIIEPCFSLIHGISRNTSVVVVEGDMTDQVTPFPFQAMHSEPSCTGCLMKEMWFRAAAPKEQLSWVNGW